MIITEAEGQSLKMYVRDDIFQKMQEVGEVLLVEWDEMRDRIAWGVFA